jgi:hypothetical protein
MCEVCVAGELLGLGGKRYWKSMREEGVAPMRLRAISSAAEFQAYVLEVKRGDDAPLWFAGEDLAGAVGRLGVDVKWIGVDPPVKGWLGGGEDQLLIDWMLSRGHRKVSQDEAAALGLEMHSEALTDQEEPEEPEEPKASKRAAGAAAKGRVIKPSA